MPDIVARPDIRSSRRRRGFVLVSPAAAVGVQAGLIAAPAGADTGITVVARGLANPRHLTTDGHGSIYVAQSGRGAANPAKAPCIDTLNPETQQTETFCYGTTGAITRIRGHHVDTVVTGLPSVAGKTGEGAGGVSDLTAPDDGHALAVVNLGGDPRAKAKTLPAPAVATFGHLLTVDLEHNRFRTSTDVSAFETAKNPDAADPGSGYDSNPYAVAASRGGAVVADAGGNDLLSVDHHGRTSLLAVFHARLVPAPAVLKLPPGTKIPMQSVPNSVVKGPDGAWYVGELTGFPFVVGAARVWRVVPGQAPTVFASGFTNIIDLAFDGHGHLLVLEIASKSLNDPTSPGALWRVGHDGKKTLVTSALTQPGGVAVQDGAAYVTNLSTSPDKGQVLRIRLNG
jgi:hypothetical protein